jgi:flavin reductase (DIM6/NTAB) family NADH-FMN oxidoreductase RutF
MKIKIYVLSTVLSDENGPAMPAVFANETEARMHKYWLITGSIAPRPIAFVTSSTRTGFCNAAPYSSFTYMGEEPPLMVIGVDRYGDESHRPEQMKDTQRNIVERGEFVVNMVDEDVLERMVLAQSPIAWECKLFKILDFSKIRSVIFGEIIGMYFRDDILDQETLRVRGDRYALWPPRWPALL